MGGGTEDAEGAGGAALALTEADATLEVVADAAALAEAPPLARASGLAEPVVGAWDEQAKHSRAEADR